MDSYRDHSDFLKGGQRYAFLFSIDPLDYASWAYGLKKAGYATNPKYPQIIIKLIEDYHLQDYSLIALGKKQPNDAVFAKSNDERKQIIPAVAVVKTEEPKDNKVVGGPNNIVKENQYPSGEFKINDTRVIYAQKGTSFLSIAQQYNVALSRLFEFNDLSETEALATDQLLYLQRKRKTGNNEIHTVQPGETLYDIAQQEAIRMESLLEYNFLQSNMQPAAGQQIYLRSKAPERPLLAIGNDNSIKLAVPGPTREEIAYKVQAQETIYSISKKYNVKIDDLVLWNQLTSYNLKPGQQLRIYK
jgi:LysM repeat protein